MVLTARAAVTSSVLRRVLATVPTITTTTTLPFAPTLRHRKLATSSGGIPVVDFSRFLRGNAKDKERAAKDVVDAFKNIGFVYISGHGIPDEVLNGVYDKSKRFFDLPLAEKEKIAWETPESNRGYVAPGREKVTQLTDAAEVAKLREASPDLKESLEIGKEPSSDYQNRWPTHDAQFRTTMMRFYDIAHDLHLEVMRSIALGLGLGETFFDKYCDKKDHNLRLLHYPEVPVSVFDNDGQARAGAHTDYGSITLLFQDDRGGLQVQSPDTGAWIQATPIPGTIVINAGDLLSRWSNDVIRSTNHRVVSPPPEKAANGGQVFPARYSIAYFCNPNMDAMIEGLPGIGEAGKYEPVLTKAYMVKRLSATY
ncbi:hypothetical protein HDU96_006096 [Phlyctochytrium bullatum]|nr:hypothetical protein HDU96_006096 [Phlyctochytrium bullatum]